MCHTQYLSYSAHLCSYVSLESYFICLNFRFYIDLSWLFSTCIGLVLFLIEIGIIFFVKFYAVNYITAAYITTAMLSMYKTFSFTF